MPHVNLTTCEDERASWQRSQSSVESNYLRGFANTSMTTRKRPGDGMSLDGDESSDRWVAFTMNGSLEMGNVCAHDTTSSSQRSVSNRTPEIHNYGSVSSSGTTEIQTPVHAFSFCQRVLMLLTHISIYLWIYFCYPERELTGLDLFLFSVLAS